MLPFYYFSVTIALQPLPVATWAGLNVSFWDLQILGLAADQVVQVGGVLLLLAQRGRPFETSLATWASRRAPPNAGATPIWNAAPAACGCPLMHGPAKKS